MTDQVDAPTTAVEEEEGSAKKRLAWLFHNTRRWLVALVLLVVAGIVVGVSYAAFTSSSANAGNVVAAGSLVIDDDLDNGAILQITGMVPGDTDTGSVTISNVGDSSGTFTLSQTGLTDTPGPNGGNLSTVLVLTIVMDGVTATPVYSGSFAGLPAVDLGEWAPDESHAFDFDISFPSGANDDTFQQSQVTTTYVWDAVAG